MPVAPISKEMRKSCWSVLLAALTVLLASASPAKAIVGGATTDISEFPYQAYLLVSDGTSTYFCGGSIRDALHVITARHCVFNLPATPGQAVAASKVTVVAGTTSRRTTTAADFRRVSQVSYLPVPVGEPADAGDAALLTLAQPLSMAATREQALSFIGTDSIAASLWAPGRIATVSGWGQDQTGVQPDSLKSVDLPIVSDSTCTTTFGRSLSAHYMVCAGGQAGADSCFGDSGGPLVVDSDPSAARSPRLVGIVSFGEATCGKAGSPGVYTEVGADKVRSFLSSDTTVTAPRTASIPTLSTMTPDVGQTVACAANPWTGADSVALQLVREHAGTMQALTAEAPTAAYTVGTGDRGWRLQCLATASNAGGAAYAQSAFTAAVPDAPVVTTPAAPAPAAPPAPSVPPTAGTTPTAPAPTPAAPADVLAPVARITAASCRRATCRLTISVADAGFSSGVKRVSAVVRTSYRTTCRRGGRTVRCTKTVTRRVTAKRLTSRLYHLTLTGLRVGTHAVAVTAVDNAGNLQPLASRRTLRTRSR